MSTLPEASTPRSVILIELSVRIMPVSTFLIQMTMPEEPRPKIQSEPII